MNPYSSLCDDFGVYVYVEHEDAVADGPGDALLHFFDGLHARPIRR